MKHRSSKNVQKYIVDRRYLVKSKLQTMICSSALVPSRIKIVHRRYQGKSDLLASQKVFPHWLRQPLAAPPSWRTLWLRHLCATLSGCASPSGCAFPGCAIPGCAIPGCAILAAPLPPAAPSGYVRAALVIIKPNCGQNVAPKMVQWNWGAKIGSPKNTN